MKKRIISFAIAFVMLCSMMSTIAFASTPEANDVFESVQVFVLDQVKAFSAIDDAWDETTEIKDYIALYAPDDTINGYIFHFETYGVDTGFMQIGIQNQEFYVVNLGFEGADVLSQMVEYHNSLSEGRLTAQTETEDIPAVNLTTSSKVYYTGGFNYYLYGTTNELISLSENEKIEAGLVDLEREYSFYKAKRVEALEEIEAENIRKGNGRSVNVENFTVSGYSAASRYLKTMSNWSSYVNHCTPTAATNYVMYWKYGRGLFANHAASSNQNSVFTWFYKKMKTNQSGWGTSWSNIQPAYTEYFRNYSGKSNATFKKVTSVTFSNVKTTLNRNIPLHLEVRNYAGAENHSVNVWGYYVLDSKQYLRISDNWGTVIGNILIAYNSYSYGQYVYFDYAS